MHRRSVATALVALAGMLFLQAAIAFAPCELPGRSAATASAVAMAGMPDCQEAEAANLCLAHCTGEDQALFKVPLDVPQLVLPAAGWRFASPGKIILATARPAAYLAAAGPPPRILFQSFLL